MLYFANWYLQARLLGRKRPIQSVVFITDRCNLRCKHCSVICESIKPGGKITERTYNEVIETLRYCYDLGSRIVDLEGGEPMLWRDQDHTLNDLVRVAKDIGFYAVTVTTNGQQPIETDADLVWISIDGTRDAHDDIRGEGTFDRIINHIHTSTHPCLNVNMVINPINQDTFEDVIQLVADTQTLRSISLNFHTPHLATREFLLDWEDRGRIVDRIIELKKKGAPILNSVHGLRLLKTNRFKKQCWITNFCLVDGTNYPECPGSAEGICDFCGFGMAGEMASLYNLHPGTLLAGLKLRLT